MDGGRAHGLGVGPDASRHRGNGLRLRAVVSGVRLVALSYRLPKRARCRGVSSQFRQAHLPKLSFSMLNLQNPAFINSIAIPPSPVSSVEMIRLRDGSCPTR